MGQLKTLLFLLFFIGSLNVFAQYPAGSPVALNGKLKVTGNKLQSECGNNVQLRGMSSHGLQWTESCVNGSLDALVGDWKIDIFRLAMYVQEDGYATNPTRWKAYIDNMVDECGRRGIYCLIDWHVMNPGDPNADIGLARDFWTYMATKHNGKKHVLYEICNEPNGVDWNTVKRYADDIIPRIRAIDPGTVIIVGSPEWSSRPEQAAQNKLNYPNLAYALHFYAGEGAHTAYRQRGDQAMAAGLCVFATEFGTSPASGTGGINTGETGNWMSWMRNNNVSWCNWSYSDIDETSAALNAGACATSGWNNTTPSGSYIKGQTSSADAFTNCNNNIVPPTVTLTTPANNTSFITNATFTATATGGSGSITKVDYYATTPANVTTLIGTVTTAPYTYTWNNAPLGTYTVKAVATSSSGVAGTSGGITVYINVEQSPYLGTVSSIPGSIQAENYDVGGNMNSYYDNTVGNVANATSFRPGEHVDVETNNDGGAGYHIGFTAAGEWLEYSVNVASTNRYTINFRVASGAPTSNTMRIEMDGTSIGTITIPGGGSWTSFQTIALPNVQLTSGPKTMRIVFVTGGANLNFVEFQAANAAPTVSITAPANNATFTAPASITINANASDTDGSVSSVAFYNGSTLLVSDNSSPYNYSWTNVPEGTYNITAIATDNSGAETTSSAIIVEVNAPVVNVAPTVSITGPADNATFTAPASITINADAADSDGTISSVAFYSGTTLLVSDASSPYSYAWANVPAGTYTITAVATDNSGEETTSSAITIVVDDPSNVFPTVSITSPATMTNFNEPATVTITADAADTDGTISSVAFYNGSTLLGTDVSSPYSYEWSNIPVGSHLVLAVATDNSGGETVSTSIYIVVNATVNVEPIVSITAPAENAVFTAPANVTLSAVAEDSDGTVTKVDFYTGSTLLGSDASSPYSYTWSNLPVGNYSVVAVATDNGGAVTTSSMISFTVGDAVNVAPTVSITGPANNATFTAPASITINADAADTDGTVSSVAFYNGTTLLVSDASSPYSYVWTNVAAGTYTITARATDNDGEVTTSSPITIVVNAPVVNVAPTVSITGPANNATFTAPASITINADAADTDGTVSSVAFYNGTTLLVSDASSPYSYVWTNVAAGTYTITARATDNDGEITTSSPITLVVNAPVNVAPTVTITSPANNATFTAPASITISADATDADGTINSVSFYSGSTLLVSDASSPYSYTWANVAAGTYTITAIAADNGGTTSSTAITIVVNPAANDAPTVNITSPANNAIYTEPATITINATATDTDGTISNVYFYNGSDLIGSDATAPYSYELSNLAAGTYTLTARATDNSGATSISTDIIVVVNPSVNVNDAPTVSITSPANNDSLVAPASITINANAADSDGTVSNVYFYNGSDLIGSDASAPYSFVWSNVAVGTYTLTARATDNEGATTSSAAITVFVTGVTPTGVTIQGETACSVNGTLNESANTGFRGTGYVNTSDSIGAAATWAVNSTTAQTVSLGIRYATATTPGRSMSLLVNGTTQVATIPFANTGSATTWAVSTVQINLVAGANTLSLVSLTAEGSPYLDEIFFNSTTVSAGSCTTTPNTAPTVSITSPANNFTYSAPATINIVASASDADGTVSSVQLFNGSTLLINDLTSPYSYTWANVAAGTYILTAVATDNNGAVTTSSPITVVVNPEVSTNGLTIQAETACKVDGTSTETANEGFNGTSYVNTTDAVGATAAWAINSSSNQVAVLTIRYAHATSAGRAMSLRVNGTTQVANIPFPSTGSSAPWTTTDVQVALSTGTNTIELVSLTDEGSPYIDELTFVSTTVAVGACPTPVTFQAENACSVDGTLNETANGGFNGTGYVNTSDIIGAKAVWVFNSLSSQTVSLAIRYAHTTSAGRPMSLSVNGSTQVSNIAFASTGGNSTWLTSSVQVNLAAGANTIELISLSDEGSPYIDELTFGSSTIFAGTCPVPVSIQAETACSVDGSLNENANGGFTGTGYVNTSDIVGAKAVWVLNSPTSQTVSLGIRYAHTTSAGRAMSLRINGVTQVSSIAFPSTGGNSTWLTHTVQVSLLSGANTIELISLTDEGSPYIDQLTFGSSTVSAGSCPIPVTIQAENACSVVGTLNETANSGFRGTGYVNTSDAVGAKAVWAVNSPTSQTVSLTIRYAHTTLAGRPMSLSVNGLTQVANIAFPNSPNNTTWVTSTVQVNLASGDNILELVSLTDEGSPYIDELVFGSATVSASACPTVSGVTVQAETACSVNGELNESIYSGFRGTGYVNTSDSIGAAVSWVVNSQSDQTINLEIRYAHSTLVGRSMALNVNGVNQIADLAFSSSISDSVWITTIVQVSLLTGDNTIELVSLTSAGSPYIDELTYGTTTVTEGTCPTVTPVTIQAETACSVDGTLNETANTGFNGTGYFNTNDSIGASASYVINSTTAQTVSLGIRYATSTAAGRAMSLSVNGSTQVANIPFANSGGAWIISTVQINLTAGENTVTLVATTDEGSPYVDELIFGSSTVSAGTCPTTNPNPNPGDCIDTPIPSASRWTVTNDWSDQYAGSGVSNTSDALSVNHRAWGYSNLWIMETGKTFAIQSGTTYTISFDLQNDLQLPVNSIDVGFGTGTNWNGPRLAQSSVNVSTTDSASRRTVTITSNVNATVFLALKLNWTSQVNNQAIALINNISICPSATPQSALLSVPAYETGANPFVDQTTAKVIFDNTVPMQLRVLDLSGMVQLESDAYTTNQDFYVGSGLPAGTYIVQAVFEGQVITFRLIKN